MGRNEGDPPEFWFLRRDQYGEAGGNNLQRLVEAKRTYDPHGRFQFRQSMPKLSS
jgi:FAD/FMN-containing dehydrogenase